MGDIRCIYCGAKINDILNESTNPYDNGLHETGNKFSKDNPKYSCHICDNLITHTNRLLSEIVFDARNIDSTIFRLKEAVEYIESNRAYLQKYYLSMPAHHEFVKRTGCYDEYGGV